MVRFQISIHFMIQDFPAGINAELQRMLMAVSSSWTLQTQIRLTFNSVHVMCTVVSMEIVAMISMSRVHRNPRSSSNWLEHYPITYNDVGNFKCEEELWSFVIHTCPNGSECEFTHEVNDDVNTFVPMYDINRHVNYISGQCAACNNATDVRPWDVSLSCVDRNDNLGFRENSGFWK